VVAYINGIKKSRYKIALASIMKEGFGRAAGEES